MREPRLSYFEITVEIPIRKPMRGPVVNKELHIWEQRFKEKLQYAQDEHERYENHICSETIKLAKKHKARLVRVVNNRETKSINLTFGFGLMESFNEFVKDWETKEKTLKWNN